jgi:hypothetical protein
MIDKRLLNKIAQAMELKEIKDELRDGRGEQFIDHCEKIILWGKTQDLEHWSGELWGFCEWIQRTKSKSSNKPPKANLIENYFCGYDENENMFVNSLDVFYQEQYGKPRKEKSKDSENFNKFRQFCKDIAQLLSESKLTKNNLASKIQQYLLNK